MLTCGDGEPVLEQEEAEDRAMVTALRAKELDSVAERIRRARERLDWTQADLARASGISQGQISRIEHGLGGESANSTMIRLASALGVSVSTLTQEAIPPTEADLPDDLREQIRRLPLDLREVVGDLIEQGRRLPDTPEGREAFTQAVRVAVTYLRGLAAEDKSQDQAS